MLVISPLVPVASVGCANTAALSENCPNSRLARRETPLARRSPQRFAWGPTTGSKLTYTLAGDSPGQILAILSYYLRNRRNQSQLGLA